MAIRRCGVSITSGIISWEMNDRLVMVMAMLRKAVRCGAALDLTTSFTAKIIWCRSLAHVPLRVMKLGIGTRSALVGYE